MRNARWISGGIGLAILAAALSPPFLADGARAVVMQAFAAVCHQLPDRSASIGGIPLAACDRCMGIYFGLPLAALLMPLLVALLARAGRRGVLALAASVLPIAVDWSLDAAGLLSNTPSSRWVTGLVFGLVAGHYLVLAVRDLVAPRRRVSGDPAN